jgi:membrane-bound serine protease (ClpP class)
MDGCRLGADGRFGGIMGHEGGLIMRTLAILFLLLVAMTGAKAQSVAVLTVEGGIDPAMADYLTEGMRAANERPDTRLIVLQVDTPGGLSDSMERTVQSILASRAPVCVFVAPSGARAASAGAIIALAAPIVAMAPATNIGAATPINGLTGGDLDRKVKNDAAARARALADLRHRPRDWAERVVLKAESITADEAVKQGLADVKANDIGDLLTKLDGREVLGHTLDLRAADVRHMPMPWGLAFLHLLANPNVAYILLLVAIYGILAEVSHPGAIVPGVAGSICALLAFYGMAILSVNIVGLLLILLGVGLFVAELVLGAHGSLSIGGVVAFIIGSLMLVRSPLGTISLWVIGGATLLTVAAIFAVVTLAIRAYRRPITTGREAMAGQTAVARSPLGPRLAGQVLFEGSLWNAVSAEPVEPGETVRVTRIEGLTLTVHPVRDWGRADAQTYASEP